jgi:type IV pilus assembly protein PilW
MTSLRQKYNISNQYQKGFTLIELMVALVLGLLVSAAAVQLFTGSILSTRMQQANDELQNSGIFGLDYIVRDIRLANYENINNPELNEQTPWGELF